MIEIIREVRGVKEETQKEISKLKEDWKVKEKIRKIKWKEWKDRKMDRWK